MDFVIWTGDSARHDKDEQIPRTESEVLELNTMMVNKFTEVFGKDDYENDTDPTNEMIIPIVPNFGNNDILPHNIMFPGPNRWTKQFSSIWKKFIPEEQRHAFQRGGWFYVEVIPHQLAVVSLNTLYLFDSNGAVDGCAKKSEPGYEQMDWLRIQLQFMRERGMKAIIIGHVPPARTESKQSWEETCWQKYALWMQQYRDVVVGSSYGHMNIDHFMLQDFKDIKKKTLKGRNVRVEKNARAALDDDTLTAQTKTEYLSELRTDWAQIPDPPKSKRKSQHCKGFFCELVDYVNELKTDWARLPAPPDANAKSASYMARFHDLMQSMTIRLHKHKKSKTDKYLETIGGPWGESYALSLVSPSVIPNYFPTLRIIEYNISGVTGRSALQSANLEGKRCGGIDEDSNKKRKKKKKKKHHSKKPKFTVPLPPSKGAPPGPAYSPQTFSWLGFTQYYANLTTINNDFPPQQSAGMRAEATDGEEKQANEGKDHDDSNETITPQKKWREGKHSGKHPKTDRPKDHDHHHATFKYEIEYSTRNDSICQLPDLTVRSYLDLARRIGHYGSLKEASELERKEEEKEQEDDDDDHDDHDEREMKGQTMKKHHKKKKHKKKKHHHHKGKGYKVNEPWFTFVRRAFVGAVDDEQLKEEFGIS